jgi:phytoene dehydrogenase-like protein
MEQPKKEKEVLIIGGGIAGLSAGIYARQNEYKTTIVEMGEHPGGQLTAWQRNGYTFDYCLHWLVGSDHGAFNDIYREIGAINDKTETINHDIFLKTVDEEFGDFYFYTDMDRWEAYLKEMAPEDSKGIHKLCNMIKRSTKIDGFKNPPGMRSVREYLGQILKGWRALPMMARYVSLTNEQFLKVIGLKNTKLCHFLDKVGLSSEAGGYPAIALLMVLGWQHDKNAGYLKGGSGQMTQRIQDTYTKLGGEFRFHARVKEILVEDGVARGVILEDGERLLTDHVISACDGHTVLFDMLGGKYVPPAYEKAYDEWTVFTPLVLVGFGIDKTIVSDAHHTEYFCANKIQIGRTAVAEYGIMNRSMYDDTLTPEGKTALELFFESPWDNWKDLSDAEYAQEKKAIKNRCTELLEKHYPGIAEHIEVVDLATPRTTERYTGVWKGSYEGFELSMDAISATINSTLPMELDGLKNFTMAGQWVMPGGGLPTSAQSGRWAVQKLTKSDKKKFKHFVPT